MAAGERHRTPGLTNDRPRGGAVVEDNKARVRRYVEEFQSGGKVETADALVAADILHHHGPGWTLTDSTGREGANAFIAMLRAAFPTCTPSSTTSSARATRSRPARPSTAPTAVHSGESPQPASR
jgi:hypothetical protein